MYIRRLPECSAVIIGGSLPQGIDLDFYGRYIQAAREHGIPVIFDSSGPPLRAGLENKPAFVKPNQGELSELCRGRMDSLEQVYVGARALQERFETSPVVTLGPAGALAVLPERAYLIPPLDVEVISSAGAGDAVLAGLAASIDQGSQPEDGLRLGFAAAAAVMLTPGTADCRAADVERLIPEVKLEPYPPEALSS
jgi:fructose-1-phosphate kinase PfkB-like protein